MVTCSSQVQSKEYTKCKTKYEYKSHLTIHLDCPSAPLGEVEPVRLDLVLGDPLGLVLEDPQVSEEGFLGGGVSSAGAELKLGYCCTANLTWRLVFVNIAHCVVVASSGKRSTFSLERVTPSFK